MPATYAEVIGDPIAHSKSPAIHRFWLEQLGLDGDYRSTRVASGDLRAYFQSRRSDPDWRGCNVTVPHKEAVLSMLGELTPMALAVGAVNTVFPHDDQLAGANTDVDGVVNALPSFGEGELRCACLIGSGGAARAAIAAFKLCGVEEVLLNVRNIEKGERLLAELGMKGRVASVADGENFGRAQVIVNASTLGMTGQAPMPEPVLQQIGAIEDPATIVFDMVYAPLETELLRAARARGLRTVDGLQMLIGQAAVAFEAFFGAPAPREHDAELRALLTS
jgi:shikimate dehydrogenase